MTLTELKYIVAVARERHFGKAAEACFVSQPTLSVAIKKLEEELELKIFERNASEIAVTPLGEEIVRRPHLGIVALGPALLVETSPHEGPLDLLVAQLGDPDHDIREIRRIRSAEGHQYLLDLAVVLRLVKVRDLGPENKIADRVDIGHHRGGQGQGIHRETRRLRTLSPVIEGDHRRVLLDRPHEIDRRLHDVEKNEVGPETPDVGGVLGKAVHGQLEIEVFLVENLADAVVALDQEIGIVVFAQHPRQDKTAFKMSRAVFAPGIDPKQDHFLHSVALLLFDDRSNAATGHTVSTSNDFRGKKPPSSTCPQCLAPRLDASHPGWVPRTPVGCLAPWLGASHCQRNRAAS